MSVRCCWRIATPTAFRPWTSWFSGDDRAATDTVQGLADQIPGLRGVYGGRLRNCGQVEAFTANLISINRRYKGHAGIQITDLG